MSDPVIFIVGPTGSGKSHLALMLAKKIKGEIVSSDSMQVYRKMNIGTAKPTKKEQKEIKHYLLDLFPPEKECSVFKYRELAVDSLKKIIKKGQKPIVAGGSGLYIKAIIDGLSPQPGKSSKFRLSLKDISSHELYQKLKMLDPARATKINPNDKKRVIRALEIYEITKRPMSEWENQKTSGLEAEHMYPIIFGVSRDRKKLYERIEKRVDRMLKAGWIDEVKKLKKTKLSMTARYAIGYKEILEFLSRKISEDTMKSEIKKRTRHLAKRQMTWFRKDKRIHWITIENENYSKAFKEIMNDLKRRSIHAS